LKAAAAYISLWRLYLAFWLDNISITLLERPEALGHSARAAPSEAQKGVQENQLIIATTSQASSRACYIL